jgi:hypothetical protein
MLFSFTPEEHPPSFHTETISVDRRPAAKISAKNQLYQQNAGEDLLTLTTNG